MTEAQAQARPRTLPGWRMIAVAVATAVTGAAALIAIGDPGQPKPHFVATADDSTRTIATNDPLVTELQRCRSIPAGADDAACRATWEASRRRFIGEGDATLPPLPAGETRGH